MMSQRAQYDRGGNTGSLTAAAWTDPNTESGEYEPTHSITGKREISRGHGHLEASLAFFFFFFFPSCIWMGGRAQAHQAG